MKNNRKYNLSAAFPTALAMLSAMMLSGCSAVDTDDIGMTEDGRVPIEFTISGNPVAALVDDPTRAGEETSYTVSFLGLEHTGNYNKTDAPTWVANIENVTETGKKLNLNPKKYYDPSKNTSISGFYPPIIEKSGSTSTTPALIYTSFTDAASTDMANSNRGLELSPSDGTVDVLSSGYVSGSESINIGNVKMKHLTSQVVFKVMAKEGEYKYVKNLSITSIILKDASVPYRVKHTGELENLSKTIDFFAFSDSKTIPQEAENIGKPAFLYPGDTLPKILVNIGGIQVSPSVEGVSILEAGKKYVITIIVSKTVMPSIIVVSAIGGEVNEVDWNDYEERTVKI